MKDGVLLDDEEIAAEEEVINEGLGGVEQGDDAFVFIFFLLCWNLAT